jgi:processive 1,2-diacylglycerol beta-glucosyltransferase
MKKILIFYTSIGLGHKYIAQNIGWQLEKAGFNVKLADIGEVQKGKTSAVLIGVHGFINEHMGWFWSYLYKSHFIYLVSSLFRIPLASRSFEATLKFINEFNPDLVITVQTTASAVLSFLKSKKLYTKPWAISFSDFHLHLLWLYKNCDFYFANIQEQKDKMVKMGYEASKILVCGITLKPKVEVDAKTVRAKLGISEDQKVILVGIGSLGIGLNQNTLDELTKIKNAKVVIACGKNQKLFEDLSKKYGKSAAVKVLGFYSPMDELYAIADVFVTKPGGLTTAEALRQHLPLVVTHWLPGQEELNISYLTKLKLITSKPKNLAEVVERELENGNLRKGLMESKYVNLIAQEGELVVQGAALLLHEP